MRHLLTLIFIISTSWAANGNDVWLKFDFNGSVAPTEGTVKDKVDAKYNEAWQVAAYAPKFELENGRQGIFLGKTATNLLSPGFSDLSETTAKDIIALLKAKVPVIDSPDARFGKKLLNIDASGIYGGGVSLHFIVPGFMNTKKNNTPGIFAFSFYVRGKGMVEIRAKVPNEISEAPKSVNLTAQWQRVTVWLSATAEAEGTVEIVNNLGFDCSLQIEGLKLENKSSLFNVNKDKADAVYSYDASASPWSKGEGPSGARDKEIYNDVQVSWKDQGVVFPYAEGSYAVWFRPGFNRNDLEDHAVISKGHVFYQLTFQEYGEYSFFRCTDTVSNANGRGEIRAKQPEGLINGEWCFLTATWSNKDHKSALYFNGKLVGERESNYQPANDNARNVFDIGARNGVIDELTIYSRALNADEIYKIFCMGKESIK